MFEIAQGLRIQVEVVADTLQQGKGFIQLDGGRIQQRIDFAQAWLVADFAMQMGAQVLQLGGDGIIASKPLQGVLTGGNQRGGVGLSTVIGIQLRQRFGLQCFCLQFCQLVLQPCLALGHVATRQQGITQVLELPPVQRRAANRCQQCRVFGEGVQQLGLGAAR